MNKIVKYSLWSFTVAILFMTGFVIGGKAYEKKSLIVNAAPILANSTSSGVVENDSESSKETELNKKDAASEEQKLLKEKIIPPAEIKPPEVVVHNQPSENPYKSDGNKVAYLTFDDGPSIGVTPKVLDVLSKYNIKATFFVIGRMAEANSNLLIREKQEGHVIGNHTYSHVYKEIYAKPDNLIAELSKCNDTLKKILGEYDSKLIRFPGGSFGTKNEPYRQAVVKAGYHYVDWNSLNGDAEAINVPVGKLVARLKETVGNQQHVVILMHDAPGKATTADALPQIIDYLISQGYTFKTLN